MSVAPVRLRFSPLSSARPALRPASTRHMPDDPGPPVPWWAGGMGGTGTALATPSPNGQAVTGCGNPSCTGRCGLRHDDPPASGPPPVPARVWEAAAEYHKAMGRQAARGGIETR